MNTKQLNIIFWGLRLIAAFLLLQTLFFKFTASEESVYIFTTLGIEPWGRIGSGIVELVAGILILFPKTTIYGAILGLGVMSGAIFSHLTKLGLVVKDDGGQLFAYALIIFIACAILAYNEKQKVFKLIFKKQP